MPNILTVLFNLESNEAIKITPGFDSSSVHVQFYVLFHYTPAFMAGN